MTKKKMTSREHLAEAKRRTAYCTPLDTTEMRVINSHLIPVLEDIFDRLDELSQRTAGSIKVGGMTAVGPGFDPESDDPRYASARNYKND